MNEPGERRRRSSNKRWLAQTMRQHQTRQAHDSQQNKRTPTGVKKNEKLNTGNASSMSIDGRTHTCQMETEASAAGTNRETKLHRRQRDSRSEQSKRLAESNGANERAKLDSIRNEKAAQTANNLASRHDAQEVKRTQTCVLSCSAGSPARQDSTRPSNQPTHQQTKAKH